MGKTLNDLYAGIYDIARVVTQKGGTINSSNISPSFEDIKNGINSIPYAPTTLNGVANVVLAEMPNVTIKMETESGVLVDSKTTNATNGGSVSFSVTTYGNYRFTMIVKITNCGPSCLVFQVVVFITARLVNHLLIIPMKRLIKQQKTTMQKLCGLLKMRELQLLWELAKKFILQILIITKKPMEPVIVVWFWK